MLGVGMMVWVPYYCSAAVMFVVAVVAVVLFLLVSMLARIGVLGHRRGTALGHPCRMPPTGINIAVLLLKTWVLRIQPGIYLSDSSLL